MADTVYTLITNFAGNGQRFACRAHSMTRSCAVPVCERPVTSRGWCDAHYQRWWANGIPGNTAIRTPIVDKGPCAAPGCDRLATTRGWCNTHYSRWRTKGKVGGPIVTSLRTTPLRYKTKKGYVVLDIPGRKTLIPEHRWVMEQHLGRPLRPDESVHHLNGVRDDNRLENLELWCRTQPSGQRVEDLVAWADEILARYAP